MKENRAVITTTYNWKYGFRFDIVREGNLAEAWLYHKEIGIKSLMFGAEIGTKYTPDYDAFLEMVKNNLMYEGYCKNYADEYMNL